MQLVKNFKDISKVDVGIAGGKGASLGEMTQAGISIPPGFVILADAFEKFLEETDLNIEIDAALKQVKHNEVHTVENASEKIRAMILAAEIPKDLAVEIKKYFKTLGAKYVAVRSSATSEDSASAAWAGQLDSFLNTTPKTLLENVKKCWASLFTPRAIFYRFEKGLHNTKISVAVVVQKMVESEKSGIAFSVHPVTQDENQLIIEAGFGLGEAIVSGTITPDSYVVGKRDLNIIDVNVNEQTKALYRKNVGGNQWKELGEKGREQVLKEKEILELAKLVIKIENHYGFPCDIEWAREKNKFYIVQSRPITTLEKQNKLIDKTIFQKAYSRELFLFLAVVWSEGDSIGLKQYLGQVVKSVLFLKKPKSTVMSVWYDREELDSLDRLIADKVINDSKFFPRIKEKFIKYWQLLEPYSVKKEIKTLAEFKKFYDNLQKWWPLMALMFWIPATEKAVVNDKVAQEAIKLREKTEKFSDRCEKIFVNFFSKKYPQYKKFVSVITPAEVLALARRKFFPNDLNIFEDRLKNGFAFLSGEMHPLSKIDELQFQKEATTGDIIKGQIAFRGKISGQVVILHTVREINKVKKGNIIIAPMTTPAYLPAMKKAAAFVTDEGGVTCHAAIVAREMKKPCIIGTKNATRILKDGDLVEVDAEKGVVKILKKTK